MSRFKLPASQNLKQNVRLWLWYLQFVNFFSIFNAPTFVSMILSNLQWQTFLKVFEFVTRELSATAHLPFARLIAFLAIRPNLEREFDLNGVAFAFVAIFFSKLDRNRREQAECNIDRLKVFCFDVGNITA